MSGAGFELDTTVELVSDTADVYPASEVEVDSFTRVTAKFAALTVPPGTYRLRVSHPSAAYDELPDAFTMISGGQAKLETNLVVPSRLGYHQPATIYMEYKNSGDLAMPAPILVLRAVQRDREQALLAPLPRAPAYYFAAADIRLRAFWTSARPLEYKNVAQILGSGKTPGVLQPGESMSVPVDWIGWERPWDFSYPPFRFSLVVLDAENTEPVDWPSMKDKMRPEAISSEAWEPLWANFVVQTGTTWGDYVEMLTDNAAYLGKLSIDVTDISELLAFEFAQANGLNLLRHVSASIDAYVQAPGLDIVFQRVFPASIIQRYRTGFLGRGWSHNWDTHLDKASDGTITMKGLGGSERIFQPDSRTQGRYFSMIGDHGTFNSLKGGGHSLREKNGMLYVFHPDGKLNYVQDTNGNTITADYSDNLLKHLRHSRGQDLDIHYNASNLIETVTDPSTGRQTNFIYGGESGEHLVSVRYYDGSEIHYAYYDGPSITQKHALLEVEYPGNSHRYFTYDAHGRLEGTFRDNDAEKVTFSYSDTGLVSITDALGNTTKFFLDYRGLLVKVEDPLGNVITFAYDELYNLRAIVDPAGRLHAYEYDDKGNVARWTDPMGNTTMFGHEEPFNRLTELIDAKDNITRYGYNETGNLESITYAVRTDLETVEQWEYPCENLGDPSGWRNRRGQKIRYEYDEAGRLTAKIYPDDSRVEYRYDVRGNLALAMDATGEITLEY